MTMLLLALALIGPPQDPRDSMKAADAAMAANRYDEALAALGEAEKLALKAKDTDTVLAARERKREAGALKKEYDKVKDADGKLAAAPDDPEANTLMGQFYCFVRDDWARGLPLLAKGADAFLKALAELELTNSAKGEDKVVIGNGWWTGSTEVDAKLGLTGAAGTVKVTVDKETAKRAKQKMIARAAWYYAQAWPLLQDAERAPLRAKFKAAYAATGAGQDRKGDVAGWEQADEVSKAAVSQTYAHGGRSAAHLSPRPKGGNVTVLRSVPFRLIPGKEYELSAWYLTDGTDGKGYVTMACNDASGKLFQPILFMDADVPYWTHGVTKFKVPAGVSTLTLNIGIEGAKGSLWVDDVSLKCEGQELLQNGGFEK